MASQNQTTIVLKTYSELLTIPSFHERFQYLSLRGSIGIITFGFDRYLNQDFYNSWSWRSVRDKVIIRDNACDLGILGRDIYDAIRVHHMNPIQIEDIKDRTDYLLNPNYLICSCLNTHNAIHYGKRSPNIITERKRGDTCLWK